MLKKSPARQNSKRGCVMIQPGAVDQQELQRRRRALVFIMLSTTMMWLLFDMAASGSAAPTRPSKQSEGSTGPDAPQIKDVSAVTKSLAAAVRAEGDEGLVFPYNITGLFTGESHFSFSARFGTVRRATVSLTSHPPAPDRQMGEN